MQRSQILDMEKEAKKTADKNTEKTEKKQTTKKGKIKEKWEINTIESDESERETGKYEWEDGTDSTRAMN